MSLRAALVALLAASTILFAVGVIAEPSAAREPPAAHAEAGEAGHHEQVAGVNSESTPLVVLAAAVGLTLAVGAATALGRRRAFLVAVAAITLVWAAFDVRELVHQLGESRAGIAAIAATVALLHLGATAAAGRLARG